jgi:hypothetical protein
MNHIEENSVYAITKKSLTNNEGHATFLANLQTTIVAVNPQPRKESFMQRLSAILLVMALIFTYLPCIAQDPVPFNSLAHMAAVQPSLAEVRAMSDGQSSPSGQPAKRSHWTKGGKVMTYIGIPVMAAGGAMLAYGLKNGNSTSCNGGTCVSVEWKWTGVAWLGVGGALTTIGVTRRSSE